MLCVFYLSIASRLIASRLYSAIAVVLSAELLGSEECKNATESINKLESNFQLFCYSAVPLFHILGCTASPCPYNLSLCPCNCEYMRTFVLGTLRIKFSLVYKNRSFLKVEDVKISFSAAFHNQVVLNLKKC